MLGLRFHGGFAGAIGSIALATLFGVAVCSVFAPAESMPGWLWAFVEGQPHNQGHRRDSWAVLGGPVARPLWQALAWIAAIMALFAPLTIAKYRRRV